MGTCARCTGCVHASHAHDPSKGEAGIAIRGGDIVFAKARCALEAMATGSAVVLCDAAGLGPMVSDHEFEQLRQLNFGAGTLKKPLHSNLIADEIRRYDADNAAWVSQRVRAVAGLDDAAKAWLALYEEAIAEHAAAASVPEAEAEALADYVARWGWDSRIEWELKQLSKLRQVPVVGNTLLKLAKTALQRLVRSW